jgi:hypothetical protein
MEPAVISPTGDPYRPYLTVGYALALAIIAASCAEFAWNYAEPGNRDFESFWDAGKFALAGTPALAYGNTAPFLYAPAFLLLLLPFAALAFPLAMALWSTVTLGLYAVVARGFAPRSHWLTVAFAPVYVIAAIGQNGFVTGALFLGGLALLHREKKFAAGLVLGCLILKPQLALMLPVAMLAGREWRVIAGAIVSALAVLLVGAIAFGPAASVAWLSHMPLFMQIARGGVVSWSKLDSIYAASRQAGLSEQVAFIIHGTVALVAAVLVARLWSSDAKPMAKAAVLGTATMLASPYIYLYDALVLIPAFVWLVERRTPVALVASLWLLPIAIIAQIAQKGGSPNIGPLLQLTLLALCWLWGREKTNKPVLGAITEPRVDSARTSLAAH